MVIPYGICKRFITRRSLLLTGWGFFTIALLTRPSPGNVALGIATASRGTVSRQRQRRVEALVVGSDIMSDDLVKTGMDGFADLKLGEGTHVLLGNATEFLADSFTASQGGTMELGTGRMIFDRPEELPKINVTLQTAFGMIGVRGTKFFCGPNRGVFAVFVERGEVSVSAGGISAILTSGEGIDIERPGAAPSNFVRWSQPRITEAYASVGIGR